MSSPTLGVVPKLLPVTGTYLVPFTLAHVFFSFNVVRIRLTTENYNGTIGNDSSRDNDPLHLAIRTHQNFIENVPLALLAAGAVELNGGSRSKLSAALGFLLLCRVGHYAGLTHGFLPGRVLGYYGTSAAMLGLGGWLAYLCRGYWNL